MPELPSHVLNEIKTLNIVTWNERSEELNGFVIIEDGRVLEVRSNKGELIDMNKFPILRGELQTLVQRQTYLRGQEIQKQVHQQARDASLAGGDSNEN